MARKLKVFRTSIGFHDAYIAAPSQKAALSAWGADANLFARGVAEEVTDETLTAEPLARPGEIVRKVRGTLAEHMAALPKTPKSAPLERGEKKQPVQAPARRKSKPRPKRDQLAAAEAAIAEAQAEHLSILRDIADREAALAKERKDTERAQIRSLKRLEKARAEAEAEYNAAVAKWRDE